MSSIFNRILENLATRLMFIIYIFFIAVTVFFIAIGYYHELNLQKKRQYDKLQGIVAGVATNIDGDSHEFMIREYNSNLKLDQYKADSIYRILNSQLSKVQKETSLKNPLYTLISEQNSRKFYYGVRSDDFVDINNEYLRVPDILKENYEIGGVIPVYETENGTWISAFHPIKKTSGEVVALLEADIDFSSFITNVNKQYLQRLLVSLAVMAIIFLVFVRYARKILKEEMQKKKMLSDQKRIIEFKNKDITDSMHYALKIQDKILPAESEFENKFSEHFIMYQPKDIVAGDFYWMKEIEGEIYVAVADCTGHGVPGAILSIICAGMLEKVVCQKRIGDPGKILNMVRAEIIEYLTKGDYSLKDGMDIAFCRINLKTNHLSYAGAYNPIYIVREKQMTISIPNKQPIGNFDALKKFESSDFSLLKNDIVYLFTDGYADQFGGPMNKKFKLRNFKELLLTSADMEMEEQKGHIEKVFRDWMGSFEQIDDVCLIGLKI